jgi:pilus assembly protein CpaB
MRSKRALFIAIILAIVAVMLMYWYTQQKIGIYSKRYNPIQVVIAAKNIDPGTILDESLLELRMIPEPFKEPDAVTDDPAQSTGYIAAIGIMEGEQITENKLIRPESIISGYIPKGKRAFTIAINEITGVAGLIRPKDRVDIIGIFKTLEERTKVVGNAESVTLLQNVEVLQVGRTYRIESLPVGATGKGSGSSSGQSDLNFTNITLLLTPRECMDIGLAQEIGTLTLTLRPKFDYDPPRIEPELKSERSRPSAVTGIKEQIDIAPGPKWLEQRGERSLWVR